jgi:replication-associated recombination protein RarA
MSFYLTYEPKSLSDVVISSNYVKAKLNSYIVGDNKQPLILHGSYGTGKTTIAKLLPNAIEGKKAEIEYLKATEFSTISDVNTLFNGPPSFYTLFSINGQKRNYLISNEINFTPKAAIAFRDIVDSACSHTQLIFTTNDLERIDRGLRDRSMCLHIEPARPHDWLDRAKMILKTEGVSVPDTALLELLHTQLGISTSNRKLLEALEQLVYEVKNKGQGGSVVLADSPDLVPA